MRLTCSWLRDDEGEQLVAKLYRRDDIRLDLGALEKLRVASGRGGREHVVTLREYGTCEGPGYTGRSYELLEYVPKGSLRGLLDSVDGPLDRDLLRSIVAEITSALRYLHHELDIVHRDLRPENVLVRVREPLDLVLADFGMATIVEMSERAGSRSLSPFYASPEALLNVIGRPRDYWALGMMVLEALDGQHPFHGLSDQAVHAYIQKHAEFDVRHVADERWRRLCEGLLTREPNQRWAGDEIEQWLAGKDPEVRRTSPSPDEVAMGEPFEFPKGEFVRTLPDLARALAANWGCGGARGGRASSTPRDG